MKNAAPATGEQSELQFASLVDACAADPKRHAGLIDLLREDHPLYDQRGSATVVRMRGWILLALARAGVSDPALLFVLEELDTGKDAYLVAAAARALRSYPRPGAAFAPFVIRALTNIRDHDAPVSFESYGEYAVSPTCSSPIRELIATLEWLGPHARGVLHEVEALRAQRGLSKKTLIDIDRAMKAIAAGPGGEPLAEACCRLPDGMGNMLSWARSLRRDSKPVEQIVFEDHAGASITFGEFFQERPSIVVFFYTRCDNPMKCSLTVAKLARLQKLLESRGFAEQIRTAAITYDSGFDLPERLRGYGQNRGLRMDANHRMLRTVDSMAALRSHFQLGINFVESLVNRHRIEVYILDPIGRIAARFQRTHWEEQDVLDAAVKVLNEKVDETTSVAASEQTDEHSLRRSAPPMLSAAASLGVAFFPKCPACWAAYLSVLGIAGMERIPYSPWLLPLFAAVMLVNLASVWVRGRSTKRMTGFYLVSAGALTILASNLRPDWESAAPWGVALTFAGSLTSALSAIHTEQSTQSS